MEYRDYDTEACSIARTAELIGRPWTMVVLRDVMNGVRRFDDLVAHLGIARTVLSSRLDGLVAAGLVKKVEYKLDGSRPRYEYRLTPDGWRLRPVLIAMIDFGDAVLAGGDGPPVLVEHADCGAEVHARLVCDDGHVLPPEGRLTLRPGPGAVRTG